MKNEQVSVYVVAHKKEYLDLPEGYDICQVNTVNNGKWDGPFVHDNNGADNISLKNDRYSELTALYELWKNSDADIKGLAHYRRFFADKSPLTLVNYLDSVVHKKKLRKKILKKSTIIQILATHDIIVEYPRNPYVVNAYEDLTRFVFPKDIQILSDTIHLFYPEYEESYYRVLRSTYISYMNMFIAKKEILSSYCEWLFGLLFRLEEKLDIERYDSQHKRIFGYIGEVLLNVWILKNKLTVKNVFCFDTVSSMGKYERIKTLSFYPYIRTVNMRLRKKEIYSSYLIVLKGIRDALREPYTQSLDDIYNSVRSVNDVLKYYSRYYNAELSEEYVTIAGRTHSYACVKFQYDALYQYRQSNSRYIATLFEDDAEIISALVRVITEKYKDHFTINIRIVTHNQGVSLYAAEHPEIYVFYALHGVEQLHDRSN